MSELAVDQLIDGKYRIVRLIGQGAWATVYEAINVRIQRRVAIKILNIELASQPELCARFRREAQASTQIESPFVVTMFDAGSLADEGGRPYIVMEFLEGEDLAQRLHRLGPLEESVAVTYAIHLLSGLADAHATGVLHRDIKPDNLVIVKSKTGEEIVKLVDFGISKPTTRPSLRPPAPSATNESSGVMPSAASSDPRLTTTDVVLGSPVYMSPEQARGTRYMDHRSDLFSVGVVLYELLTNEVPHEGSTFNDLMFKVALETAPDPRTKKPDLDAALAEIIMKSLAREPEKRYQTAVEFRTALIEWAESHGVRTPPNPFVTSKIRVRTSPTAASSTPASAPRLELEPEIEDLRDSRPSLSEHVFRRPSTAAPVAMAESTSTTTATAATTTTKRNVMPIAAAIVVAALLASGGIVIASLRKPPTVVVMQQQQQPPPPPIAAPEPSPTVVVTTSPIAVTTATTAAAPPSSVRNPQIARGAWPPPPPRPVASSAPQAASVSAPPAPAPTPTGASVEGRTVRTSF